MAHAGGYATVAGADYQTVIGKYNVEETAVEENPHAFIVGNGTKENSRSNALTID